MYTIYLYLGGNDSKISVLPGCQVKVYMVGGATSDFKSE